MIRQATAMIGGAAALALLGTGQMAQARSGRASYHLHTGAMVTAARYEPRGSILRVTNPQNGRSVIVRVNDRGPFNGGRILDLSTGAFAQLYGGLGRGVGPVQYEVISSGSSLSARGGSPRDRNRAAARRAAARRARRHRRAR